MGEHTVEELALLYVSTYMEQNSAQKQTQMGRLDIVRRQSNE
jgi:hypothetical protein